MKLTEAPPLNSRQLDVLRDAPAEWAYCQPDARTTSALKRRGLVEYRCGAGEFGFLTTDWRITDAGRRALEQSQSQSQEGK